MQTKEQADLADLCQAAKTPAELRHAANLCDAHAKECRPLQRASWLGMAGQLRHRADRIDGRRTR